MKIKIGTKGLKGIKQTNKTSRLINIDEYIGSIYDKQKDKSVINKYINENINTGNREINSREAFIDEILKEAYKQNKSGNINKKDITNSARILERKITLDKFKGKTLDQINKEDFKEFQKANMEMKRIATKKRDPLTGRFSKEQFNEEKGKLKYNKNLKEQIKLRMEKGNYVYVETFEDIGEYIGHGKDSHGNFEILSTGEVDENGNLILYKHYFSYK